jgi:hypothetical protein
MKNFNFIIALLNDKTSYDLLKRKFGEDFSNKINIKRIPNKKVKLISHNDIKHYHQK